MKKLLFLWVLILLTSSSATIRYVSKTGTSTPPYTSWGIASDSIQKCINYAWWGDTIIVGNGVYREKLKIDRNIVLLGLSVDSSIIDARNLITPGMNEDSIYTIVVYANLEIRNFYIYGYLGSVISGSVIYARPQATGIVVTDCIIEHASSGVSLFNGINRAENLIIKDVQLGIHFGDFNNTSVYEIKNNILLINKEYGKGIHQNGFGRTNIIGNTILYTGNNSTDGGILLSYRRYTIIKNNLVAGFHGFQLKQSDTSSDSLFIINNVFGYNRDYNNYRGTISMRGGEKAIVRNNIILYSKYGISQIWTSSIYPDYNLYWGVEEKYNGANIYGGEHELMADPMVIKDTIPTGAMTFNFHLQKFSPAIDAGDPLILDRDGTRSDIGMYGGPSGEIYHYEDFPPKTPKGVQITTDSAYIYLKWKKNTETDFLSYRVYSDTIPGFIADSTKIISEQTDTLLIKLITHRPSRYYFRISAVDSAGNESVLTSETGAVISSTGDNPEIIQEYELCQNYPNPFNPETRIPYRLKRGGKVRISIYDITGQLIATLVNEYREAGYHEEVFRQDNHNSEPFEDRKLNSLVSGIYLYRIEVTGDGNMPVYSDMKKMVLIK